MKSLNAFLFTHSIHSDCLRLGQRFCNTYLKDANAIPGLFYEENDSKAKEMIRKWLEDNNYAEELPTPLMKELK